MVAWKPRFCFAAGAPAWTGPPPTGGPAGGGAPGGTGGVTPDIIIVPLNFDGAGRAVAALSSVPHATHVVASSVFGLPQFGQKTVTGIPPPPKPLRGPGTALDRRPAPGRTAHAARGFLAKPPRRVRGRP
jgi:hypothetical protein